MLGVMILAYKQEEYIDYCLRALYPYVNLIQVMYSDLPFIAYNQRSREEFREPDRTHQILDAFPDTDGKLTIKEGVWDDEESMREEAARLLYERGAEICLINDADEFWPDGVLPQLLDYLKGKLHQEDVAWAKLCTPFKRFDRLVDFPKARLPVAVRVRKDLHFVNRRIPEGKKWKLPDIFYFWHLGYVLCDERMYEKIRTYSHALEIPENWYTEKWLNFTAETVNLCRKDPARWPRTKTMSPWDLPSILFTHPFFPDGPKGKD